MWPLRKALVCGDNADVAQLVEHNLAKVGVAGSNPVVRSLVVSRDMPDSCLKTSRTLAGALWVGSPCPGRW